MEFAQRKVIKSYLVPRHDEDDNNGGGTEGAGHILGRCRKEGAGEAAVRGGEGVGGSGSKS